MFVGLFHFFWSKWLPWKVDNMAVYHTRSPLQILLSQALPSNLQVFLNLQLVTEVSYLRYSLHPELLSFRKVISLSWAFRPYWSPATSTNYTAIITVTFSIFPDLHYRKLLQGWGDLRPAVAIQSIQLPTEVRVSIAL